MTPRWTWGPRGPGTALLASALVAWATPATAQPEEDADLFDPAPLERGDEGGSATTGEESASLAALRAAERELFGPTSPPAPAASPRLGLPPGLRSTTVGDVAPGPTAESLGLDLSDLRPTDLPVRWQAHVLRYLDYFRSDRRGRRLMRGWIARSARYGPMIQRELRAAGQPEDLRCVAMAESGFDPTVRSRRGAAGMWQFVAGTGGEYGLTRDRWLDARLDPVASTRAAARFLGDLHQRFGSWELALAAYNMGYGALLRAIRKYNTNDYWTLASLEAGLPFETRIYVAKISACAVVMRNPERFGYEDLPLEDPLETEGFELPGGVTLGRVARAAGVELSLLRALNPQLLRGRTPPDRPAVVHVPAAQAEAFATRWTAANPGTPAHRPYVVPLGEDLGEVARRFRTRGTALRTLNAMEPGERVTAGDTLLVPAVEPLAPRSLPEGERPLVAVPRLAAPAPEGRTRVFYPVRRGDRLEDIAAFFRVEDEALRRWNGLDARARLQSGMILQVFAPAEVDLGLARVLREDQVRLVLVGSDDFHEQAQAAEGRVRFRYTCRDGDTLSALARRFGLSVGSIGRINGLSRRSDLAVGQELVIYAPPERVPADLREARREGPTDDAE